jgi:hypothetical protein
VGGSDRTAIYWFIAAAAGAKYCLALARSNAGVVANVRAVEMFARDRSAAFEENMESAIQWFPRLHAALGVSEGDEHSRNRNLEGQTRRPH